MYRKQLIPTLTYGLELTHMKQCEINKLDVEGCKALKLLFNFSKYGKNLLHKYYKVQQISTIINNNKLNLLYRLMRNTNTSKIILQTISQGRRYESLVWDCVDICSKHKLNFYHLILNVQPQRVEEVYDDLSNELDTLITECIRFWNIAEKRKTLRKIIEERIPERS